MAKRSLLSRCPSLLFMFLHTDVIQDVIKYLCIVEPVPNHIWYVIYNAFRLGSSCTPVGYTCAFRHLLIYTTSPHPANI